MHNLQGLGTASLDTMGGLITNVKPQDLPEGASPMTWDTDYITGSVFTRPGLQNVFVYTTTFAITQVYINYNVGTFYYTPKTGTSPTVNEGFLLNGFTGSLTFLNGQIVVVTFVDTIHDTFMAEINYPAGIGPILTAGFASSTTGTFLGPNVPTVVVPASSDSSWTNPGGVFSQASYASSVTGSSVNVSGNPTAGTSESGTGPAWSNPNNIFSAISFAITSLSGAQTSNALLANGFNFNLPTTATVVGLKIVINAYAPTGAAGQDFIQVQLATNGFGIGTVWSPNPSGQVITTTNAQYTLGSSSYQWGVSGNLSVSQINGSAFGVLVTGVTLSGTTTINCNNMGVTVYYTTSGSSEVLKTTGYTFVVPVTSGISGIGVSFQAYSSAATTITAQLLLNGIAIGTAKTQALTTTPTIYSLGTSADLWGNTWSAANINSPNWGVQFTANGTGTTYINDVDALAYITPALVNYNYMKSYELLDNQLYTLALDASGILWQEDVTNLPGALTPVLTGILPNSFARSATMNNNEYICFSNLQNGTDRPRDYFQGQSFLPISQVGPGAFTGVQANITSANNQLNIASWTVSGGVLTFTFSVPAGSVAPSAGQVYNVKVPSASYFTNYTGTVQTGGLSSTTMEMLPIPSTAVSGSGAGTATLQTSSPLSIGGGLPWSPGTPTQSPSGYIPPPVGSIPLGVYGIFQAPANSHPVPSGAFPGIVDLLQNDGTLQGNTSNAGDILTVYYVNAPAGQEETLDPYLLYMKTYGLPCYVYLVMNIQQGQVLSGNAPTAIIGTYLVSNLGANPVPPPGAGGSRWYFQVKLNNSAYFHAGNNGNPLTGCSYQLTAAMVTIQTPLLGIQDTLQISGVAGAGSLTSWNGQWPIVQNINSSVFTIQTTQITSSTTLQYTFNFASINPTGSFTSASAGLLVNITNCDNPLGNAGGTNIFNGIFTILSVTGNTMVVSASVPSSLNGNIGQPAQSEPSNPQAQVYGTQFLIDPGANTFGILNAPSPIYGNYNNGETQVNDGFVSLGQSNTNTLTAGTRQAIVFFITKSGYWTPASPPCPAFTTGANATSISVTLPIGPPDVVARAVAFTEAGQNGIAGANYYVIEAPSSVVINNVTYPSFPTIVWDNVTKTETFTFTDSALLAGTEIDVPGADQFNLIEIGSPAWCTPYANRMFYGLTLNKVQNFVNMSFDGGTYDNSTPPGVPAGWTASTTGSGTATSAIMQLINSSVTGVSLYVINSTGAIQASLATLTQSAYQDAFMVPIINPNTLYSVRIAARTPSGATVGTVQISLVSSSVASGVAGSFSVNLSQMTTNIQTFSGTLLTTPFVGSQTANVTGVPSNLNLTVSFLNFGIGADVEIDRIEIYPTLSPVYQAQVFGSYVGEPEAIDAGPQGGIIDTSTENPQPVWGGFVQRGNLYFLKTSSMYSTQENPNAEPSSWGISEVSTSVGACGINAYDYSDSTEHGEEWAVMACRPGVFGFQGGQPIKVMQEIWDVWNAINWAAGGSIVVRNDITNRRLLIAVPLPTPNQWLPYAPTNLAPISPNVILMCNYQGLHTFEEFVNSPQVHTTMFGTLAAVDMKRKWSIWQVPTPYMGFITRQNLLDAPLMVGNGINTSKIYQFSNTQYSDDGAAIWGLYTTYGFVNAAKAATLPIFGFHAKRYTILQTTMEGAGSMQITAIPNSLNYRYPYNVPPITLESPANDDWYRNLNQRGNRMFLQYSTNAVGSWFSLSKILLSGKADPWSTLNPTGGGNRGVTNPGGTQP